ncbi:DUF2384 domain-containing protein [Paraburkholderia sp. UCT31]|uniref:MbcA/ParS/Xre antitoxin family protein n=1 Tax=Paraburkholderia sp. UCT31 TaxID=2615209 RepID=UPI001655291F|nr:MbcA/ParS/Xre antitoxin family protein [Paraburkholderia sp. UCT31]MBC8736385.1 DUF2384 domain-containing protein [Paraburkholderia sp. UCT31]
MSDFENERSADLRDDGLARLPSGAKLLVDVDGRVRPLTLSELQQVLLPLLDKRIQQQVASLLRQQNPRAATSFFSGGLSPSRAAEVQRRALEVFRDPAKADAWMNRPSVKLGGVRPVDYLDSEDHASAVEGALDALAYGAPL